MQASEVWGPLEFQFTDPEDVELYGDRWYYYSEADLIRMRARDLIILEGAIGMAIVDVMNGARVRATLGNLAAAWIGVRAVDPELAGEFNDFNPLVMQINWRPYQGKAEAEPVTEPTEPATPEPAATGSPEPSRYRHEISEPTATVALQTSPVAD